MPVFAFLVVDSDAVPVRVEMHDVEAARAEALRLVGELIRDSADRVRANDRWRVEVMNEAGIRVVEIDINITTPLAAKRATPP